MRDDLILTDNFEVFEEVRTRLEADTDSATSLRGRVMVDSIHAGDVIPARFARFADQHRELVARRFDREKDWAADHLADELANQLGLECSYRVGIARAVLDFGRFPGITRPNADHLRRFAINDPFSRLLPYAEKRALLEEYYDTISEHFDRVVMGKRLKLSVHTYDRFNPGRFPGEYGTERPLVSLVFGVLGYHEDTQMPYDVFDELLPDELGELTADRRLTARILLNVANQGISITHNHPYWLPEGSVEVRAQVWFFFDYLRRRFDAAHAKARGRPEFDMVWNMLLDTNLRRSESEHLRSYLHMFRQPPAGQEASFAAAAKAYGEIREFLDENRRDLLGDYQFGLVESPRPSSLMIEVRKDHLWWFEDEARMDRPVRGPSGLRRDNLERIARLLAAAIRTYVEQDLGEATVDR